MLSQCKAILSETSGRRQQMGGGGNMKEDMKTVHMAQDRKYWKTEIMAGPEQGDGQIGVGLSVYQSKPHLIRFSCMLISVHVPL